MKHGVLGAGAIGGIMATALGSVGEDVTLIVRPEKLAAYPKVLSWENSTGTITTPAKAVSSLTGPTDVLWITTKTYQLEAALGAVEVVPNIIIPLLNGVDHIALLRARFGQDRVIPATIAVEAERRAAGSFVQRSPVRLGIAASGEPILGDTVARLQTLGFACRFVADEMEQALLPGAFCAGDVSLRKKRRRNPGRLSLEAETGFGGRRGVRRSREGWSACRRWNRECDLP